MRINILYLDFIKNIRVSNLSNDKIIELYKKYCIDHTKVMNCYFKKYFQLSNITKKSRILNIYDNVKKNYYKYKSLNDFNINEYNIISYLDTLKVPKNIFRNLDINFFLGLKTCQGFAILSKYNSSINIAIETFIEENDLYKKIYCTILHELSHIIRFKYNLHPISFMLGDMIIEEGLACIFSKKVLNLNKNDIGIIFPNDLTKFKLDYKSLTKKYIYNLFSINNNIIEKFMNSGWPEKDILPGTGYILGTRLLENYMKLDNCSFYKLFFKDNKTIINFIFENETKFII